MSRFRTPAYRYHKASGQAVVTLRYSDGSRKDYYLGLWKSPESRAEYARIIAESEKHAEKVNGHVEAKLPADISINEVMVTFLRFAAHHYRRPDGTTTNEVKEYRYSLRPLRSLYGFTRAAEFGPLALKVVREQMIQAGWCRKVINQRIGRIKRMFKWAVSEELVPPAVFHGLLTVTGLQQGRTTAKETAPIKPVAHEVVIATLPFLTRHVAGLVRFQMLTGCRPGEACSVRRADIDTAGLAWIYRPQQHKLAYRGHARAIALGPQAQELLFEFPTGQPTDFIFSPIRCLAEVRALRATIRKTPKWPSHMKRNEIKRIKTPLKSPSRCYKVESYARAVSLGIKKANMFKADTKCIHNSPSLTHWHPNQLRHSHATKVRMLFGLEAAQVSLGHARADITQVYAEKNLALAEKVALAIG
jgi:integrase